MSRIPDIEEFEERAAIAEYDGGLSRSDAEGLAERAQGSEDAHAYWKWLTDYLIHRKVPH